MSSHKSKWYSLVFVLLLTLSGLSFVFLVGRSQQARADQATEQFQLMGDQVKASGAVLTKGADVFRRLLVK
ncbi:MAG: preprotein translocase subunit YajC [Neolewinella sp.]|jgi:preprotein translocase subunit YajC